MKGSNGGFWHWWLSGLAISIVAACFSSQNIHSVGKALFQLLRSLPSWFWALLVSHHPLNVSIPDTASRFQLARFSILFGMKFYKQQLVLGKPLSTVKWSTFCVSFMSVLTIFGWLWGVKIFKINYLLLTSNVWFGTVSINLVTFSLWHLGSIGWAWPSSKMSSD